MKTICYNNKDNLMAGLICGGWDPYEGGQVYEIPLGGTIMRQKFAMFVCSQYCPQIYHAWNVLVEA